MCGRELLVHAVGTEVVVADLSAGELVLMRSDSGLAHVARDSEMLVRLLYSSIHQSQFSTCRPVELMASWAMCVFRDADKPLVEERVWLSETYRHRLTAAKDLDALLFHLFQPVFQHLNFHQVLLVHLLERLHTLVLRKVPSCKCQLTLAAAYLNPLALFTPVQYDVLLTFKKWRTLRTKHAPRLQLAGLAVLSVVLVYVSILEDAIALLAFELRVLEQSHHDSIHILEAIPLFAVRAHVLVQNHPVLFVPTVEALPTVQRIALFALPRLIGNIVAYAAEERVFEGLTHSHIWCQDDFAQGLDVLLDLLFAEFNYLLLDGSIVSQLVSFSFLLVRRVSLFYH